MRSLLSVLLCALTGVGVAACTTTVDASGTEIAATAGSVGILRVERTLDGDPAAAASRGAALGAAFARYRGIQGSDVAQLLGGGAALDADACTSAAPVGEGLGAADAEVELLDVGIIDVRVGTAGATLEPRTFPELGSVATGVFYAGDGAFELSRAEGEPEYVFSAAGSSEVLGFEVAVGAPEDLTFVRVDGAAADARPTLVRSRGLDVAWEPGDPHDRVEIELRAGGDAVLCVARDDGAFRVDGSAVQALALGSDARLVVRRVRVQSFDAPGVDAAWVRVSTERTYGVALE